MDAPSRIAGTVLSGRYRLERKLGEGGMGEVYAAQPVGGGARVALKVLRGEYFADMAVRTRFVEEARACASLIHPNVVRVFECATTDDGLPYLVMELLEGVPLGAYMQGGARVPVAQAVPILQGLLAGLAAAHASGIVHRDLKPDNVFLTRDPEGRFVVKLLDFGIAKVMDVAGGMGTLTRSGVFLGTPAYMSPEQARSARNVDQRADLWSAGVLFYEMLSGQRAFPAPTELARLAALLTTEPVPIEEVDPSFAPFGPFFRRALKKDREERFSSAIEMSRALAAAMTGAPSSRTSTPASPVTPSKPGVQSSSVPRGTLASPEVQAVSDPPPQVAIVVPEDPKPPTNLARPFGGTLESRPPAAIRIKRAVPEGIVVALVLSAFVAGTLLGWLLGRAR